MWNSMQCYSMQCSATVADKVDTTLIVSIKKLVQCCTQSLCHPDGENMVTEIQISIQRSSSHCHHRNHRNHHLHRHEDDADSWQSPSSSSSLPSSSSSSSSSSSWGWSWRGPEGVRGGKKRSGCSSKSRPAVQPQPPTSCHRHHFVAIIVVIVVAIIIIVTTIIALNREVVRKNIFFSVRLTAEGRVWQKWKYFTSSYIFAPYLSYLFWDCHHPQS